LNAKTQQSKSEAKTPTATASASAALSQKAIREPSPPPKQLVKTGKLIFSSKSKR
jgi:hypothetical protein